MTDPNPRRSTPAAPGPAPAADRRRSRRLAAVLTPVVLAALILGLSVAGHLHNPATSPSSGPTGHHPAFGHLTLAANPLLTAEQGHPARPGAARTPLSRCVSSPLTWGAAESHAAVYGRPGQPRFGDEYVLRFTSIAAAHHAVTDAWRLYHDCPAPRTVETGAWNQPLAGGEWHLSEYFYNERGRFIGAAGHWHSLRVARRQNVVVVVETADVDDRAEWVLAMAMSKATADRGERRKLSAD